LENKFSKELIEILTFAWKNLYNEYCDFSVKDLIPKLSFKILKVMEKLHYAYDVIEDELAQELENGRLIRLLLKLNFILQYEE
jgi:PAB-dependent poly(A)-specific ribonuclease subunit 3